MATQTQQNKVSKVMREFYAEKLTTHGNKVTDPSQAKAIALSEAGISKKKKKVAKRKYVKGGGVGSLESQINTLYSKSGFINTDFNWRLKLLEMLQDQSIEAYQIYQSLTDEQKDEVLQEQYEVDNDMGSDGDGTLETTEENIRILLKDAKKGKKYAKGGSTGNIPKSVMDKINEINSLIEWAEDKDNFVGGYFGGTYYEYLDFEKPIETKNQFVYIEYNHGGGRKSSDRYNVNKKGEFDSNGLAELKSELSRILSAFRRAKKKYEQKGYFGKGGSISDQNKEMIRNQVKEAKHHSEELSAILKEDKDIDAWVVAKMERATTDLSDVTHYLDGKDTSFAGGGGIYKTAGQYRNELEEMSTEELAKEIENQLGIEVNSDEVEDERNDFTNELVRNYRMNMGSRGKKYSKGGGVGTFKEHKQKKAKELKEKISELNAYLKKLENINSKEAYEESQNLREFKSIYEAQLLHLEDNYANGGGVGELDTPKVWIGEWSLYNEGKLIGQWVDLSEYESGEEVMEKIQQLLNKWSKETGKKREEYAVFDYENFPRSLYSEGMGEESFDKVINAWKISQKTELPMDVIGQIISEYDPEDVEEFIEDRYVGQFDSDTDLAYDYVEQIGGLEQLGMNTLEMYFDYESFGRDLSINDYRDLGGYYFRSYKKGGKIDSYDLKKYIKSGSKDCGCEEGGVYHNPFLKSIFGI